MARNDGDRVENKLGVGVADAREKLLAQLNDEHGVAAQLRALSRNDLLKNAPLAILLLNNAANVLDDCRTALARSHQSKVPVAWMYTNETGGRLVEMHRWRYGGELKSWTETPLYASHVEGDRKDAEIVAAARHFIEIDRYSSVAAYKAQNGRFGHSPWAELAAAIDAAKDHQNG